MSLIFLRQPDVLYNPILDSWKMIA